MGFKGCPCEKFTVDNSYIDYKKVRCASCNRIMAYEGDIKMAKKKLIAKIAVETGVDTEDLERLSIEALNKLDELKDDPILVDEDLLGSKPEDKKLLGYHPITGKEVWL
jgi:hypothetical protein